MVELIGATLGDGNIYDKRPNYVEYTGNPITDEYYFNHVLLPIVNNETGKYPKLFVRDRGYAFEYTAKHLSIG
jgi:hypothetical protein